MVCLHLSRYLRSARRHAIGRSELFVFPACFRCLRCGCTVLSCYARHHCLCVTAA
ncbi:unnamed protein product, partial [Ectocarpus sp. 13 AM-2016]